MKKTKQKSKDSASSTRDIVLALLIIGNVIYTALWEPFRTMLGLPDMPFYDNNIIVLWIMYLASIGLVYIYLTNRKQQGT